MTSKSVKSHSWFNRVCWDQQIELNQASQLAFKPERTCLPRLLFMCHKAKLNLECLTFNREIIREFPGKTPLKRLHLRETFRKDRSWKPHWKNAGWNWQGVQVGVTSVWRHLHTNTCIQTQAASPAWLCAAFVGLTFSCRLGLKCKFQDLTSILMTESCLFENEPRWIS